MVNKALVSSISEDMEDIYQTVVGHIRGARANVIQAVNTEQVIAYWHIGKKIIEKEQQGQDRADYGKQLIKELSKRLNKEFGGGFGSSNLAYMRKFYLTYRSYQPMKTYLW